MKNENEYKIKIMDPFSVYNHKLTNIIIENKLASQKNLSSIKLYHVLYIICFAPKMLTSIQSKAKNFLSAKLINLN